MHEALTAAKIQIEDGRVEVPAGPKRRGDRDDEGMEATTASKYIRSCPLVCSTDNPKLKTLNNPENPYTIHKAANTIH